MVAHPVGSPSFGHAPRPGTTTSNKIWWSSPSGGNNAGPHENQPLHRTRGETDRPGMSKNEPPPPPTWARTPTGCCPVRTRTTDETNAPEKTRLRWPAPVQEMAMEFRYTQPPPHA